MASCHMLLLSRPQAATPCSNCSARAMAPAAASGPPAWGVRRCCKAVEAFAGRACHKGLCENDVVAETGCHAKYRVRNGRFSLCPVVHLTSIVKN